MNKRSVGSQYENEAVDYLTQNGVKIIERNFRSRFGEIDIIARDGNYYIFVEVKYRKDNLTGAPVEAVDYRKQAKISRVADYFRLTRRLPDNCNFRFDVIGILNGNITWYKNAFEYIVN